MASLFVTKNNVPRPRAISNGGMGGFVTIGSIVVMETNQGDGKATWPKNRRRKGNRPPPISIIQGNDKFFVKQENSSPTSDSKLPTTPRTPVSRYNPSLSLTPTSVYSNHLPPTPLTPKQQWTFSPSELPGSLLLPSQGFPQSDPPCTPARLPALSRSSSEESDCIWTPAKSVSSATTEIEDDEMLRNFQPKHLPRAAWPGKTKNTSSPVAQELEIGKPISAMDADELLDELPQLNAEAVKAIWIPAMVIQHDKIKKLLQDAAEVKLDANTEFHLYGQRLDTLSRDAHRISHTYEKAIQSVESLIERDVKSCRDRLETTENNLAVALTTIDNSHQALRHKEDTIQQLHYTFDDVVRVLGDFIQDHVPAELLQDFDRDDVREVIQILEDYSNTPSQCDSSVGRFLRIPEEHYTANIDALKEAQLKTDRFREVAISQKQLIDQQSTQLDDRLTAYEKSIGIISERNHEVRALAEDQKQLQQAIEDFETGFRVSDSTKAAQEGLFRKQEAMQSMVRSLQTNYAVDIQQRDEEIRVLKLQLESAKEEVMRGKVDVKNVITHTQALLSPAMPPEEPTRAGPTLKERRAMSKAKGKSIGLPMSQSMLSMSVRGQKPQPPSSIPERRQSASVVAAAPDQPTFAMMPRDVTPQWACGVSQKRSNPDLRDLSNFSPNYAPRPRKDSLGYSNAQQGSSDGDHTMASAVVNHMLGTPIHFDANKKLPQRPGPHYALDIYSGENARSMQEIEDWNEQQRRPQPPTHASGPRNLRHGRVLSQIKEMSVEDSASEHASEKDTASATSSANEEYRNGLQAVRMRDFISQTNTFTKTQDDHSLGYDVHEYSALPKIGDNCGEKAGLATVIDPVKLPQPAKVYASSQDGSSSTLTSTTTTTKKKQSPLRDVEGIRVLGDPWLSGSPARL